MNNRYDDLLQNLLHHFQKKDEAAEIDRKVKAGSVTQERGLSLLTALRDAPAIGKSVHEDLTRIVSAIDQELSATRQHAGRQYRIATFVLPTCILVSLAYAWYATSQGLDNPAAAAVIASCLGAAVFHLFYMLRVYQQGSTAAERLTEKKVGLLFLQEASDREGEAARAYLQAGTAMFLNHYAPATLPLNPQEQPRLEGIAGPPAPPKDA